LLAGITAAVRERVEMLATANLRLRQIDALNQANFGRVMELLILTTTEILRLSAAIGSLGPPSCQIHWDVDGREKKQIAGNPHDRDHEDHSNRTFKLR
jgi:hypothetical protein